MYLALLLPSVSRVDYWLTGQVYGARFCIADAQSVTYHGSISAHWAEDGLQI